MQARTKRYIKPGHEYDDLFPVANRNDKTIRRNANLDHTVAFIPKVVKDTLYQTEAIARRLKAESVYATCKNIWHFVYEHINYKKDEEGYEQIRSPARAWHDRNKGVDCDCYSVFISSILTNLGIPHSLRITKYHRNYFQHIYPVVQAASQREIILDCVTDQFDYEVPYTEKKDYPMDLQYLDGIDGVTLGLFGKKKKKKPLLAMAVSKVKAAAASSSPAPKKKKKGFFKKVLNVVNKINPATLLLRNGVLVAMKLNIKNVAKRLRWSYLSPDKIAQHGIDPAKFQKLIATRQKLENIFYGAGGNPNNLRKAILGGKGNKDKAVSGLGMLPMQEWSGYMNVYTPLGELLGNEVYYSENVEGMEGFKGFGELGEPISLASVGAAMGVIAGIVSALKQIGSIFKKGSPAEADFHEEATEAPENNVNATAAASAAAAVIAKAGVAPVADSTASANDGGQNSSAYNTAAANTTLPGYTKTADVSAMQEEELSPAVTDPGTVTTSSTNTASSNTTSTDTSDTPEKKESFWDKNKKWLKPVAIGAGGLVLVAVGIKLMKGNKPSSKTASRNQSLSGVPKKRKSGKAKKQKRGHKRAVALL